LIVSKVVLDTYEPVSIFYEIDKTLSTMYEQHKKFDSHDATKDRQYCNFLPKIDILQVPNFLCRRNFF
jgi:3-deoxy-D-manno-octulosonic acid (KDO) 8-phosphate synthase